MNNCSPSLLSLLATEPEAFKAQVDAELARRGLAGGVSYQRYVTDPVGFGEEVLLETYTDDVQAMMRSVQEHPVTVAISSNACGKTHGAARVALWWYLVHKEAQVYTGAAPPEDNLKRLLWGEIGGLVTRRADLIEGHVVQSLHVERNPQSFLTGVTIPTTGDERQREAKFSGKHAPHLLFIFDEGDAIPDEVYRGAESCMSGGVARMLVLFNPRRPAGAVYRMIRDGRANVVHLEAFKHPNVLSGTEKVAGAVTREVTGRRMNEWTTPLVVDEKLDASCFEVPDFMVGFVAHAQSGKAYAPLKPGWRRVTHPAFSYMVLGKYPGQTSNALIAQEWMDAARSRWDVYVATHGTTPPPGIRPTLGLDVAEFGVDQNVLCQRFGGWVPELTKWRGVDPLVTGDRAAGAYHELGALRVCVDATGVGSGAYAQLVRKGCTAHRVMVAARPTKKVEEGEFAMLRDQLYWSVREWLRTDTGSMLPPDEVLLEELAVVTYELKRGKLVVQSKEGAQGIKTLLGRSPDRMDGLALTFYQDGGAFDGYDLS